MRDELAGVTNERHYSLGLAEIDYTDDDAVTYTHGDHLGTTRSRTDDVPAVIEAPVYTAFGELIGGDPGTRYGYVGAHGYETFGDLDWGMYNLDGVGGAEALPLGFMHVGARWYDPATGRFLQRDPIGIEGGLNVYIYVLNLPTRGVDPTGNGFLDGNNKVHDWVARNFWRRFHSDEWIESE